MEFFKQMFNGRVGRQAWLFGWLITQVIFMVAIGVVFMLSGFLANLAIASAGEVVIRWLGGLIMLLLGGIGTFLILSLHTRRLHDLGKSAYWLLLSLVPLVNILFLLYLLAWKGQTGSNQYGEELLVRKGLIAVVLNRS